MAQRILIVEDEEDNIVLIVDILRFMFGNQELLVARDGHEALRLARTQRPDLILLDLTLPLLSGWDAARSLKGDARFQNTPVLALTANAMVGDRERALAAGCDDYLTKPIVVEEFIRFVNQYFQPEFSLGGAR
jgi:CheY-like chemotaxis protein